jgi:hypothetical protein
MLGFYLDLPAWVRAVVALCLLGGGIVMTVYGYNGRPKFSEVKLANGEIMRDEKPSEPFAQLSLWCGMGVTVVGAALLATSGQSDSEKHGYHF